MAVVWRLEWSRNLAKAPRDGTEFQVWWSGQWQPRARFNPDTQAFEIWGRTDYDMEGWETFYWSEVTHWMAQPRDPNGRD